MVYSNSEPLQVVSCLFIVNPASLVAWPWWLSLLEFVNIKSITITDNSSPRVDSLDNWSPAY